MLSDADLEAELERDLLALSEWDAADLEGADTVVNPIARMFQTLRNSKMGFGQIQVLIEPPAGADHGAAAFITTASTGGDEEEDGLPISAAWLQYMDSVKEQASFTDLFAADITSLEGMIQESDTLVEVCSIISTHFYIHGNWF